jgi:polyisoprenoid-binding protein YceI
MNMIRKLITATALSTLMALSAPPAQAAAEVHAIDAGHSEVSFQIRHLVTQVRGRFNKYEGTVKMDPANMEASSVEFRIKTDSIDTGLPDRDKHLRAADFFDVEKYPEITFKSTKIQKTGKDTYDVTGDFTMRGVTKQITLPVTYLGAVKDPWGNQKAGFETTATLNRKDFGINWNAALDNGGVVLSDEVKIAINLETAQKKEGGKGK